MPKTKSRQTYKLGKGVLVCPDGTQYLVSEMTVEIGLDQILHDGKVIRQEPDGNARVEFKEIE